MLAVSTWVPIYYLWRPSLPDEGDNHLVELAVAGGAGCIVSANKRDLETGELAFEDLSVRTTGEFIKDWSA